MKPYHIREIRIRTVVVGSGAAGFHAASRLFQYGEENLAILTENINAGTSRNTGSDKQTYYKLSLAGEDEDSVKKFAGELFQGQCVDGDLALCEAALSTRCFYHLVELGVPFPCNEFGEFIGYKTDHDSGKRGTSVGPYTSKIMTECLERDVKEKNIPILDKLQVIRLLVSGGYIYGLLCLDKKKVEAYSYVIVWCENVVLATGGPAGMYHDSSYPASQIGSSGMAFEAGARGKNLTEWQFGMASLKPRWNVSGTYMQALPKFVSTDADGGNEREFLLDYFEDPAEMLSLIFLKGYQWPFDSDKVFGGSSVIDLLVYQESILKGRRIFLDFRSNTGNKPIEFEKLETEAGEYLKNAGACFGTPVERLAHMNEPAIQFYREHGVDLYYEMLEIAVCAQHNNGGLATDSNWETNIHGLFAVGEVSGSHGVTRPGGTALNAGQVGGLRAADYITHFQKERGAMSAEVKKECFRQAQACIDRLFACVGSTTLAGAWEKASRRMSRYGGMIREKQGLETALEQTCRELDEFTRYVCMPSVRQAGMFYHLYDMLTAQKVYLSAMLDYVCSGGGSRGSALYTCREGKKTGDKMSSLFTCQLDQGAHGGVIQETWMEADACKTDWRPVREIPEQNYFFEAEWKAYRNRYVM